ncbi:11577_t:CDS:2, partial [Scutellospora calospora]
YENAGPIAQAGLNQKGINSENTVDPIPQMMKSHPSLIDFKHFEKRGPIGAWGGQYGSLMLKNYKSIGKSIYFKLHDNDPDYDEFIASIEKEFDQYKTTIRNFRCFAKKRIVFWDYSYLTQSIISIIREQGYQHEIRIAYPQRNQLISVQSDNALAQFSRSTFGQALCCCSCFGIIHRVLTRFYDNAYKSKFKSEFQMNISARDWFQRNKRII